MGNYVTDLNNLNHKFSTIGLSETWLNNSKADLITVFGYHCIHNYRCNRSGGGVSIFVRHDIKYKPRPDLDIFNENMKFLFIEIDRNGINVDKM